MTVEFSNCCLYFLTLTAVSSLSVLATGAILGFLLIEWENRFVEHFVKPVLLGILILLISAWQLHRPERDVERGIVGRRLRVGFGERALLHLDIVGDSPQCGGLLGRGAVVGVGDDPFRAEREGEAQAVELHLAVAPLADAERPERPTEVMRRG